MAPTDSEQPAGHRVVCHLDRLLADRRMTLAELAERAGVTVVNLSVLKNDRARAVRFSTLTAICDVLRCQPGDLFSVAPAGPTEAPDPPAHP
ncbi:MULTISPECIES: helix-turn-helix domain-containing protein [unclassified Solwaraspora]|uniref:helix-turn-helix domain-containing protein n=1 Tax=unclassified Solwaraspora TaxID=2627926 RepID=UPI00259B52F1|nr:helix-turn-helix transcriptional regulator [Solwaraspora sp. WMMA2056]WJK41113.1 helix-turn-helix transcriptional regulator [Solwaraspora sp. WMMA2056]